MAMILMWSYLLMVATCLAKGDVCEKSIAQETCYGYEFNNTCGCLMIDFCGCENWGLTTVPKGFPKHLQELYIGNNLLSVLCKQSFLGCSYIYDLDLSFNKLTSFGEGTFGELGSLETLGLQHNQLTTLTDESFQGCSKIKSLDLSYNNLTSIGKGTFDSLTKLHTLKMENNFLRFSDPSSVAIYMLQYNIELAYLTMQNNLWHEDKVYDYSKLFYKLNRLIQLSMDGLNGAVFDDCFKGMRMLTKFELFGGIKNITNTTFRNFLELGELTYVAFKGGELTQIDNLGMSYFQNVNTLDLSGNKDLTFDGFLKGMHLKENNKIKVLKLSNIDPEDTEVNNAFYNPLKNLRNLEELHLQDNHIVRIDFIEICTHFPNLNFINLTGNKINDVDNLSGLAECDKFTQLYVQHQTNKTTIEYIQSPVPVPRNIETIYLNGAFYLPRIGPIMIKGARALRHIDLKNNGITRIQGPVVLDYSYCNPEINGLYLYLNYNNISYISYKGIDNSLATCIVVLNLSYNELGAYFSQLTGLFFEDYINLWTLQIEHNGIKYFQPDIFSRLPSLKQLFLEGNHLKTLFKLDGFSPSLIVMVDNDIEYLTKEECAALDEAYNRDVKLWLELWQNPLACTCKSYPFLLWLNNTKVEVDFWIKCGGRDINRKTLSKTILPKLSSYCNIKKWLIIGGCALTGIIATSLLAVGLYRKRWCLKYWCIKAVRNRKRHQLLREYDDRDLYQYDAFVMYSGDDSAWVANNLVPNLESSEFTESDTESTLKLCVHQRDFLGGVDISENIVQAIDSSFKCLVILSRKFCQSEWTNFEIQMARSRSNAEGRNVIIVIRLEDVPLREMSTSLIYFYKTTPTLSIRTMKKHYLGFGTK